MPEKREAVLNFMIGRSQLCRYGIAVTHALSILACWLNGLEMIYRVGMALLVAVSWWLSRQACETNAIFLRYTPAQGWSLSRCGEEYHAVSIKPETVIGRLLTVLYFSFEDKRAGTLVVFKDAMQADDYRRLIVGLKISGYSRGR